MTMLPWREQLRLGCGILRWMFWPRNHPVWDNATMVLAIAASTIGIMRGTLWPLAAALVLAVACGIYRRRKGE